VDGVCVATDFDASQRQCLPAGLVGRKGDECGEFDCSSSLLSCARELGGISFCCWDAPGAPCSADFECCSGSCNAGSCQ
jgi:hypothetical protein